MSESTIEKDEGEAKEFFENRIKYVKEMQIYFDAHHKKASLSSAPSMKAYLCAISLMYDEFTGIYEILNWIVANVYMGAKEADKRTLKMSKQLKKLRKELKKHEPTLTKIKEAFEQTEEWLEKGR